MSHEATYLCVVSHATPEGHAEATLRLDPDGTVNCRAQVQLSFFGEAPPIFLEGRRYRVRIEPAD